MVRSKKYDHPAPNWLIPYTGRGMNLRKADAAWRMMLFPELCLVSDVRAAGPGSCW